MTKKVSQESMDLMKEKIQQLKKLVPEAFSEGKIDFDKLKQTLGEEVNGKEEKYSFNWAGRKDCFRTIKTTAKGTLIPSKEESVNWDTTENLFIEGDNLEVLKLLQKSYFGQIKMIYIDPPYNTGKDFVYKDNFKNSIQSYLEQTGQSNGDGVKLTTNPETNGRFHSDWITMMYPRLFIARNLLAEEGIIFISIDDNEVHNLRMIMNEIFGDECFLATFVWKRRSGANDAQRNVSTDHEYILCYTKDADVGFRGVKKGYENYKNPDNDPRGVWTSGDLTCNKTKFERPNLYYSITDPKTKQTYEGNPNRVWRFSKDKMQQMIDDNKVLFPKNKDGVPMQKRFQSDVKSDFKPISTWIETTTKSKKEFEQEKKEYSLEIMQTGLNAQATKELRALFGKQVFNYPKSASFIKQLIQQATEEEDIVMDFFAGTATTAQATLEQNLIDEKNRTFICVQLPEKVEDAEVSKEYNTLCDIGKERIRRVIKKLEKENKGKLIKKDTDLGFKVFKLKKSNYKIWETYEGKDKKELAKQMELFKSPLVSGYNDLDVIYECVIKEGFSLNAEIKKTPVKSNKVYQASDGELSFYICLDQEIKDKTLDELGLNKSDVFICLDEALNDSMKTNLAVQCNLKTI